MTIFERIAKWHEKRCAVPAFVGLVLTEKKNRAGSLSNGILVDRERQTFVATAHGVEDSRRIIIVLGKNVFRGEILYLDTNHDFSLLQLHAVFDKAVPSLPDSAPLIDFAGKKKFYLKGYRRFCGKKIPFRLRCNIETLPPELNPRFYEFFEELGKELGKEIRLTQEEIRGIFENRSTYRPPRAMRTDMIRLNTVSSEIKNGMSGSPLLTDSNEMLGLLVTVHLGRGEVTPAHRIREALQKFANAAA